MSRVLESLLDILITKWYDVLLVVLILLVGTAYVTLNNIDTNPPNESEKQVTREFTIEGFDGSNDESELDVDPCNYHDNDLGKVESYCRSLTEGNCKLSNCCVYTFNSEDESDGKCVAGDKDGATFKEDDNGDDLNFDYYYYKNKKYKSRF